MWPGQWVWVWMWLLWAGPLESGEKLGRVGRRKRLGIGVNARPIPPPPPPAPSPEAGGTAGLFSLFSTLLSHPRPSVGLLLEGSASP